MILEAKELSAEEKQVTVRNIKLRCCFKTPNSQILLIAVSHTSQKRQSTGEGSCWLHQIWNDQSQNKKKRDTVETGKERKTDK